MDEISATVTAEAGGPDDPKPGPEPPPEAQPELYGERRLDPEYIPFQRGVGWILTAILSAAHAGGQWRSVADRGPARGGSARCSFRHGSSSPWESAGSATPGRRCTTGTPPTSLDGEGIEIRSGVWWRRDRQRATLARAAHRRVAGADGAVVRPRAARALHRRHGSFARRASGAELRGRLRSPEPPASSRQR